MKEFINRTINEYLAGNPAGSNENEGRDGSRPLKYPWHMPGHKRKAAPWTSKDSAGDLFGYDLTEVPGLDDLHHPEGMIKRSMEEAAKVYGSFRTYYLVNGSTCGNLAALYACVEDKRPDRNFYEMSGESESKEERIYDSGLARERDRVQKEKAVIIARNCHKSVFNAIRLLKVRPLYIYPEGSTYPGIDGGISAEDIRKVIRQNQHLDIRCCIITSPTYEGIISDIPAVSARLHEAGIPLIVDEAHGAHLPFINEEGAPQSAISLGADIVIQSLHKTLPCYTQTALLHIAGQPSEDNSPAASENSGRKMTKKVAAGFVDPENVEYYLRVFQSSSPSYIFLQAMEKCISWCDSHRYEFSSFYKRIRDFRRDILHAGLKNIHLFSEAGSSLQDITRLVFLVSGVTGHKAAELLEERSGVVVEMAGNNHFTIISTVMDDVDDLKQLSSALSELDTAITEIKEKEAEQEAASSEQSQFSEDIIPGSAVDGQADITGGMKKTAGGTVNREKHAESGKEEITGSADIVENTFLSTEEGLLPLSEAIGKRITDYIYVYPPGIPLIAPFEVIKEEHIAEIINDISGGSEIRGRGIKR